MKQRTIFKLFAYIISAVGAVLFTGLAWSVSAQQSQLAQTIQPLVADVCPNIPGEQPTLPAGMQHDTDGNCYTPTTPPTDPTPEPPVDLCLNITGTQETLPAGYYRTTEGNCYLQPAEPEPLVDVCQNLDGVQAAVPEGHFLTPNNTCLPAPNEVDVCLNIPGVQTATPTDMKNNNGQCSTPQSVSIGGGSNPDDQLGANKLRNVPDVLQPIAQTLVDALPQETVTFFRSLPQETVEQIPVYMFVLVILLIIIPILQAIREAIYVRQLAAILKRERSIAEQKDNFVALASHYLRTPMTVMRNGLDMMITMKEIAKESIADLVETLKQLDQKIAAVLHDIEQNTELKSITTPPDTEKSPSVFRSGYFWGPILASLVLTLLANFFLGVVGNKTIVMSNALFQLLIVTTFITALYLIVRNHHLQKKLRARHQQLIEHERTVDETRNNLIANQTGVLKEGLDAIDTERDKIVQLPSYHFFADGYDRFAAILEKFLLLGQVQTGTERTLEEFSLREAINQVIFSYQTALSEKDITVTNAASNSTIRQNPLLFNFVLSSLIDNAIKFNKEGGQITISDDTEGRTLSIAISDNGIGIDNEKLDQLFKPFSRATPAIEFNYEGLGFSLFLNKLIMDYTGGSISAIPKVEGGTRMIVNTPLAV